MCGIAGTLALGEELGQGEREAVRRMTALLRHRGPDAEAVRADGRCALGNTRLRVLDASDRADLPLPSADGSVWLCYNGMVTNFRELRGRFKLDERRALRTTSDSEVVLRLYEELGPAFLGELSGMFSFCVYDRTAGKALLARDPFGLRPLFYARVGRRLHFASEIKALLELDGLDLNLDREALWHYFSLAYIPGRRTPFRGIHELPGGHSLEVDLASGEVSERRYYRVPYAPDASLEEGESARRLKELLRDSVRRNLAADAPVGLALSGGFDTSTLLALARETGAKRELHTYSLKMEEPSFDESRYQRLMAGFAGSIHHEIPVGPGEVLEALEETAAHLDEPSGNGAAVPTFLLARRARRDVAVLLSGEGGDELFNAYETHRAHAARRLYRGLVPGWARSLARGLAASLPASYEKLSFDFKAKRFTEGAELGVAEAHHHWRRALSEEEKAGLLGPAGGAPRTETLFAALFDSVDFADELNRLSLIDIEYYFIGDLMVKNDRMIAAHGLEGRFPYMDREVVDFAARLPVSFRLKGLAGRRIQKRAMAGSLPPAIMRRSNMGLEMPHSLWFLGGLRGAAESFFTRERVERTGVLRWEAVSALWRDHVERRRDNGRPLWCVLNFILWFELFIHDRSYKSRLTGRRDGLPALLPMSPLEGAAA